MIKKPLVCTEGTVANLIKKGSTATFEGPTYYPIPPIQHRFPVKKSVSQSQSNQKNSLNKKTKQPHNQNMGRGKTSTTHPPQRTKNDNSCRDSLEKR